MRILLIEDNEANRDLICRYLQLFEHEVSIAVDGRDGLQQVRAHGGNIDAILMDLNLPEIDGWELARILKNDEMTRALPIIALTADAMVGDREKALDAGCDDYVTKPIDFQELFNKIEALCHKVSAL